METKRILLRITSFAFAAVVCLTSCEKEAITTQQDENLQVQIEQMDSPTAENKINSSRASFVNRNVGRYYSGGSNTMHSYRYSNLGVGVGSHEGVAFNAPIASVGTPYNAGVYNRGFFLVHPQNKDFIITVNSSEFFNLRDSGWINKTFKRILFKKTAGGGTVPLYRFYNAQNSDHLFTKSYAEGANAPGYNFEGIVGYVK